MKIGVAVVCAIVASLPPIHSPSFGYAPTFLVIAADSIATALGMQTVQGLTTPSLPDFIERVKDCPVKECPGKVYAQFFAAQGQPGASTAPDAGTDTPHGFKGEEGG
jgi:hypothetical protein